MKIAIISDIHDNAHNLVMALNQIEKYNVEKITQNRSEYNII